MNTCVICSSPLAGRQRKFCGRQCKNRCTNYHHQSYLRQQARGRENKLKLVEMLGGKCAECGYRRNYSALAEILGAGVDIPESDGAGSAIRGYLEIKATLSCRVIDGAGSVIRFFRISKYPTTGTIVQPQRRLR